MVLCIAVLAIGLFAIRPRPFPEWIWPLAGAALVISLRMEAPGAALAAVAREWNVLLFIAGLMALSVAAEASGAFQIIAGRVLEAARGSRRRLFVAFFLIAAVVTLLLSNDATAIALTPIVYGSVSTRDIDAKPFLFACIFVANAASFGLPFSNPANVMILPHAHLLPYVWRLGPPQLIAIAVNLLVFLFFFRRELSGCYERTATPPVPARGVRVLYGLAVVALAYVVALLLDWPLGAVAALGALFVCALAGTGFRRTAAQIGWSTFGLLAGLFVLFDALTRAGFVAWVLSRLDDALRHGALATDAAAAAGAALFANLFNNLPVAVASARVVTHAPSDSIAYPLIVGTDIGPNLVTAGSLATILWLQILRRYGLRVSASEYLRLGVLTVPATLALSVLWLAAVSR